MKAKVQYRYEQIKLKLDEKWASPRGPEKFQELKEKCRIYQEQTGERFYAYHSVVLVYDIGPEGGRHSYKNATKVINSTIINNPKKWITDVMVHHQKYVGLCLLDIDIEYEDDVRRKAKDVENAWRKYQKIQATKGELLEVPAEKLVIEREWEDKIIRDAESHLQWLETEKDQILPIVTKLQQDLVDWQTYLKKICRLLEIEQEQISLLRELEDRQYKYWRTLIKAPD